MSSAFTKGVESYKAGKLDNALQFFTEVSKLKYILTHALSNATTGYPSRLRGSQRIRLPCCRVRETWEEEGSSIRLQEGD